MPRTTHATRGRLTVEDCRIEDLVAILDEPTDPDRLPARLRRRAERAGLRRSEPAHRSRDRAALGRPARAGARPHRRPRHRRLPRRLPRPAGRRPGHRRLRRADRRAARLGRDRRRPLREARRQRPGLERAGEGAPCTTRRRSPTTTPTTSSRWSSEAWLGPGYQVTSQVNVVNPGGARAERAPRLPPRASSPTRSPPPTRRTSTASPPCSPSRARSRTATCRWSPGPTLYLPYSQKYEPGYLAWRLPEFQAYFDEHHVQLPLRRATPCSSTRPLFHAAGHQPHHRRPAHGQPAPGVLGLRARDGDRGPGGGGRTRSTRCCCAAGARAPTRSGWTAWSPRAPRATPSPPTSTATRRSTASPRPRQADLVRRALREELDPARRSGTSCGPAPTDGATS